MLCFGEAPPGPFAADATLESVRVHDLMLESVRQRLKQEARASGWAHRPRRPAVAALLDDCIDDNKMLQVLIGARALICQVRFLPIFNDN